MKKRYVALLAAIIATALCLGPALAESGPLSSVGQGTQVLGHISFDEALAPFAGTWVQLEGGFQLYLPSDWTQYSPTEEASASGVLYIAGDGEGGEQAPFIIASCAYDESVATMDELAASMLAEGGYASEGVVDINGVECLSYRGTELDIGGVAFLHPQYPGYIFAVLAEAKSANDDVLNAILCSLSLT